MTILSSQSYGKGSKNIMFYTELLVNAARTSGTATYVCNPSGPAAARCFAAVSLNFSQ
jgi:hypothetical protein